MIRFLLPVFLAVAAPAAAQNRAVMEGTSATRYTIKVDTDNARVLVSTTIYRGGIANTGLYVSSNVVISTDTQSQHLVFYATGSIMVDGVSVTTGNAGLYLTTASAVSDFARLGGTQTFSGLNTFASTAAFQSAVYLSSTVVSQAGVGGALTASSGCISAVMALSVDGSGVSTGTLVVLRVAANGHNGYLTFTTTTTVSDFGPLGVIAHSSAPANSFSPVCVSGLIRIKCGNAHTVGYSVNTSSTRGVATQAPDINKNSGGFYLETQVSGSDGWCTVWLGGAGGG